MQQTNKYGFNLIEGGDDFLPDPLNENAQKTETALAGLQTQLDGQLKCVWGTYTGNGKCGVNYPTSLSFPFKPLLVGVWVQSDYSIVGGVLTRGTKLYYPSGNYVNFLTWGDRSISWYNQNDSFQQLNKEGEKYAYVALGLVE